MALRRVLSSIVFAVAAVKGAAAADAHYPPFGLDLGAFDHAAKAGDDFFQHANGSYLARTVIPPDESVASRRSDITDRIHQHLRLILEAAAKSAPSSPGDIRGKVGAFYAAFMDQDRVERLGVRAIEPELEAIRNAADSTSLAALMGRSTVDFYPSPFAVSIDVDLKHPDRYAVYLSQSGLGLPDIDYYTKPAFEAQRTAYRDYAAKLLSLLAWPQPASSAQAILDLETRIAQVSWTAVEQRDPTTQYNPLAPAELAAFAPGFAWKSYLDAAQVGDRDSLIATQNTALPKIAAAVAKTPPEVLKAWMAFRVADDAAPYLSAAYSDARFAFRDGVLEGQTQQTPRWKRGIAVVGGEDCSYAVHSCFGTLKWGVGQLYVKRYFPPDTQATITALVGELKAAFRHRLETNGWMGPATKTEALKKLDAMSIKVGYPNSWYDYSRVAIRRDDLVADVRAAAADDWAFVVRRSTGAVDRSEWLLAPQANNAYQGSFNDVVFPVGILQAPVFDAAADPAINYGAVGAVIGHEMTHGFDDEGRHIDSDGVVRDWWAPADSAAFEARAAALGAQYARYEPVPGTHINPQLTMGENIADLGGLSIALDAYHASLHGKPAPVLAGLTGDQRVFLGWAQAWAGKATPEEIKRLTAGDPHSYRKYRVNGVVRNIDGWYSAFGIKPGDTLYIPPKDRTRIW